MLRAEGRQLEGPAWSPAAQGRWTADFYFVQVLEWRRDDGWRGIKVTLEVSSRVFHRGVSGQSTTVVATQVPERAAAIDE